MAKKSKSKSTKRRSASTKGVKVPMHAVVHFVRMLHDRKHASKFIAHAKQSGASITVAPEAVSFVNTFLKDNNLQNARTAKGIDACPTADPWKCT